MDFHGSGATLPLGHCSTLLCFIMVGIVSQWLPHVASVPSVLINTRLQHLLNLWSHPPVLNIERLMPTASHAPCCSLPKILMLMHTSNRRQPVLVGATGRDCWLLP